jgi:hypothetical protein
MYLELAENGLSARKKKKRKYNKKPRVFRKPELFDTYEVKGYTRHKNYVPPHERHYLNEAPMKNENPYIFVPNFEQGGGVYVREDKFDLMPDSQWQIFMQALAPYQPEVQQGVSESNFLGNREDRKKNREARRERKKTKADSKAEARQTRADAKQTKADAKVIKAENSDGGSSVMDKIKDVGGSLIGAWKGGDSGGDLAPVDDQTSTPFYKKPLFIVGAIALVGGGIYLATRKKKAR